MVLDIEFQLIFDRINLLQIYNYKKKLFLFLEEGFLLPLSPHLCLTNGVIMGENIALFYFMTPLEVVFHFKKNEVVFHFYKNEVIFH